MSLAEGVIEPDSGQHHSAEAQVQLDSQAGTREERRLVLSETRYVGYPAQVDEGDADHRLRREGRQLEVVAVLERRRDVALRQVEVLTREPTNLRRDVVGPAHEEALRLRVQAAELVAD